jgi:hypothetical protein
MTNQASFRKELLKANSKSVAEQKNGETGKAWLIVKRRSNCRNT